MLKFIAAGVLGCAGLVCSADQASACHRGGCCQPCAPATVATPMPGMPATAAAPQGYRTYSYQPAAPTVQYRTNSRSTGGRAYESAINKSLGRGF